jgi:hypothetical protein
MKSGNRKAETGKNGIAIRNPKSAKCHSGSERYSGSERNREVTLYPAGRKIEVAPGVKVAPLPKEEIPEFAIAKLQPVGDGIYRPILLTVEVSVKISDAVKLLRMPYHILRRLMRGGFICGAQSSPGRVSIDLSSWFEHMANCRNDPDFWLKEANRKKYRDAL